MSPSTRPRARHGVEPAPTSDHDSVPCCRPSLSTAALSGVTGLVVGTTFSPFALPETSLGTPGAVADRR